MASQKVFIITGAQGEGKTTRLKEVLGLLQKNRRTFAGFVAEGTWENNKRTAFTLVNIQSGESVPLCSIVAKDNCLQEGRFYFNRAAIARGEKWLLDCDVSSAEFAVIDEIGIFELDNKIWHTAFQKLLNQSDCHLIITVRKSIIDRIIQKYRLKNVEVFSVKDKAVEIAERICE